MAKRVDEGDLFGSGGGGGGGGGSPTRTPDTLRSQDWMELVLGISNGKIKGLAPGVHNKLENFFVGDTPLYSSGTGETNFPDFNATFYSGDEMDPPIGFVLGGAASNLTVNVNLSQNIPVVRQTPQIQRGRIDRLEIRLQFNRLMHIDDDGTTQETARFRIEYKPSTSPTWQLYNGESETLVYGKTSAGAVKDFLINVPRLTDDDWQVRVTKLSIDNVSDFGEIVNMNWESMQMVEAGLKNYPNVAVAHLWGRATNQFSSIPEFSGVYDGAIVRVPTNYDPIARTYDESQPWDGSFKMAWTNNPAWILYDLIVNEYYGLVTYYLDVTANRYDFYIAAKWCDEPVQITGTDKFQPRFTFNMYLTDARPGMDLLRYVAGAFNSTIFDDGNGVITLRTDQPRTPTRIFTPEDVSEDGFMYSFTDVTQRHNDITVSFANPALDWTEDRRAATIDNTELIARNGRIPLDFIAVGCTDVHEAVRRANYRFVTANTEITTVSFRTTRKALFCNIYDTIYIADPTAGWSTGGRIKSIDGNTVNLRDPIFFQMTNSVTMRLQTYNGIQILTVEPANVGISHTLTILSGTVLPGSYPDRTVFTLEDTTNLGMAKPFRIMSIAEVEGTQDAYDITAIEVNLNKYPDADSGTMSDPIPYSYVVPGEPVLPPELVLESGTAHIIVNNDGTLINRIYANWERPLNAFTAYYELDYKRMDDSTWTTVKAAENDAYLGPVQDDMLYHIRLFAITPTGRRGREYLERTNFRVSGKSLGLDVPTGVVVEKGQTGWRFGWDQPTNGDYDGMEIRQGGVNSNWDTARIIARRLKDNAFQYQWLGEGVTRFFFKYRDTSGNESNQAVALDVEVFAPPVPTVKAETRNGLLNLLWGEVEGTQPTDVYQFRWGTADTTPTDATPVGQIRGSSFTIALNDPTIRRGHLRAVDVGGNVSGWTTFEVGMEDTVDPTPPPTVTGLTATAALNSITIVTDVATYKVGHGHRNTRLYAAQITEENPDPVFNENLFVGTFQGSVETFPATLATRWRFWAKWTTNDGYDSLNPSDPAEAETGRIGDNQLAEDLDLASKLADGSISGTKLAAGAIDATKFANGLEPVTIVPDGQELPTTKLTSSIVWEGQTYIWDAAQGKYIKPSAGTVSAEDIEGAIEAGQIRDGAVTNTKLAPGAIDSTKFADGVEPVTIVTTPTLPTTKSTTTIVWQGKLYRWDGTAYTASVGAVDIDGKLVSTQISDNAIASNHVQANAITAGKIAAGVVNAREIAAGAITASKIKVSAMGDALNPDSFFTDQAIWNDATGHGATATIGRYPQVVTVPDGYSGGAVLRNTGYTWPLYDNQKFPIDPNKQYLIEIAARFVSGTARPFYGCWRFFDENGAYIASVSGTGWPSQDGAIGYYAPAGPVLTTEWQRWTYAIGASNAMKIPAAARFMSVQFVANYSTTDTDSVVEVGLLRVSAMVAGELIVDGAITANKIMAESITGDKIAANSITASRLVITDTSNTYPDYDFFDEASYTGDGATQYWTWPGTSSNIFGRRALSIPANAAARSVYGYRQTNGIQVNPGAEFYVEAAFYCTDAAVSVGVQYGTVVANGTVTWGATVPLLTKPAGTSSTRPGAAITIPASVRRVAFVFTREGGGADTALFGGVMFRRKSTGVLIADNAITAEKITADAVTAGKIAAGAVNAREIAAGAVTADKMTIGGARDIVTVDPMFTSPEGWNAPASWVGAPPTVVNSATAYQAGRILQVGPGNNWAIYHNRKVPIDRNKQYVFEQAVARASAANGTYYGIVTFYDQAGTLIDLTAAGVAATYPQVDGGFGYVTAGATVGTGWTVFRAHFGVGSGPQIPANAAFMSLGFTTGLGATSTTGNWSIGMLQIREMVSGELIVAGAITANKLAANAIAVGTAAIQDAAITNAMIANLSADKITTGFLAAARIQAGTIATGHLAANSVTADKILAGSIDATKIAARSITADRIQGGAITADELVANNAFIRDGTLQGAKIGVAQIWTGHIADAQISTAKIGVAQIDTLRLASGSVVAGTSTGFSVWMGSSGDAMAPLGNVGVYLPYGGTLIVFLQVAVSGGAWSYRSPRVVASINGNPIVLDRTITYGTNGNNVVEGFSYIYGPVGPGSYFMWVDGQRPTNSGTTYAGRMAILGFQR